MSHCGVYGGVSLAKINVVGYDRNEDEDRVEEEDKEKKIPISITRDATFAFGRSQLVIRTK